jgi:hypothetical protein
MQIVLNKCYGGFSISHKAIMRYYELKGIPLYPFESTYNMKKNTESFTWYEGDGNSYDILYFTKVFSNGMPDSETYISVREFERNDPLLVRVVKELGDKANGMCAELAIVEIPDDVDYQIDEYDGIEWIAEKHRTWS